MRPSLRAMLRRAAGTSLLIVVGLAALAETRARAASTDWVGDAHAAVRLITRDDQVGKGPTIEAGLEFRFAPEWHGYWRTPGDAGLPPTIDWSGSDNVRPGEMFWPAPTRLVVEGLQNGIYSGRVVLPTVLVVTAKGAPASLHATVGFAACSKVCVPYQAELTLPLAAGPATGSPEAALLATARTAVPGAPEAAGIEIEGTSREGGRAPMLVVKIRSTGEPFAHPDLFVEGAGSGLPGAPRVALSESGRAATLTVGLPHEVDPHQPLTLTLTDGTRAATFTSGAETGLSGKADSASRWLPAVVSALIGGLVLNLMPCVLPVLSIKLLGLIRQVGAGRRALRLSLAATAAGVVASFLTLAGALIGLRWSGASLGWGIQFQQPWFLAGMASLTVLFAASLFDWIDIGLPSVVMNAVGGQQRAPLIEAFLTGAFATLLATPCSAPFVGTAVGFALAQGPREIVGIFLCLGVGMALPYAAVAACPGLVRFVPRPGPWMLALRKVLGVLLLGTAAWLLFVLWSVAGGLTAGAALVILSVLLAMRASVSQDHAFGRRRVGWLTAALAIAPIAGGALSAPSPARPSAAADWQAFDPDALPGLVGQGKTVLVDVTATWCLTCKVNDLAALGRPEVERRLARPDVIRMRADWSRPDASIGAYLRAFARYGIPLDVVYGPRSPAGEPLPELLTPKLVLDALDRAAVTASPPGDRSLDRTEAGLRR